MSRIDDIFTTLRAEDRTALMPFITAGAPSLETTAALLPALEAAGASIVELGIPFSDPIADGPVIAASMHDALERGVTPSAIFDTVQRVRPKTGLGLVAMVSCSLVQHMGEAAFVTRAAEAGIDGLIVPDIDLETAPALRQHCDDADLSFTLLVSPTTSDARLERVTDLCSGFVYVLARVGITGERSETPEVEARVAELRRHTDLPLAVGFGISTPEHVAAVTHSADAAIVGSALVRRLEAATDPVTEATAFVGRLATGCRSKSP